VTILAPINGNDNGGSDEVQVIDGMDRTNAFGAELTQVVADD
jgi:hypothetical protein